MPTAALRDGKCGPRKRIKMAIIVGKSEDSWDGSSIFRCTLRLSSFPTATGLGRWLCYLSQTTSDTFSYWCRRPLALAQFLSMENESQRSNRVRLLDPSRLSGASSASHKDENAHRCHSHLPCAPGAQALRSIAGTVLQTADLPHTTIYRRSIFGDVLHLFDAGSASECPVCSLVESNAQYRRLVSAYLLPGNRAMPARNVLQSASFADMRTLSRARREADHDPSRPKLNQGRALGVRKRGHRRGCVVGTYGKSRREARYHGERKTRESGDKHVECA